MYSGIVRVYGDPFYSYIRLLSFQKEIRVCTFGKRNVTRKNMNMGKYLINSFHGRYLFGLLFCAGILLSGCAEDEADVVSPANNDGYLQLNLSKSETRAELDETGAGTFSEGDRVGLYIDNDGDIFYQEITYTDGEWLP